MFARLISFYLMLFYSLFKALHNWPHKGSLWDVINRFLYLHTLSPVKQMDGRGSIKELFPTGKQLEPLVAPLADGKVAVGQDDLTVVLNEEGVCTQKCALNWTDIPIAMGKKEAQWQEPHFVIFNVCSSSVYMKKKLSLISFSLLLWLLMSLLELTRTRHQ